MCVFAFVCCDVFQDIPNLLPSDWKYRCIDNNTDSTAFVIGLLYVTYFLSRNLVKRACYVILDDLENYRPANFR